MKQILIVVFGLVTVTGFGQAKKPATGTAKPAAKTTAAPANPFKNEIDSVSYSIGLLVAQNLKTQGFDKLNISMFQKAVMDATQNKKPLLTEDAVKNCVMNYQQKVSGVKQEAAAKEAAAKAVVARTEGKAFLEKNAKRTGVFTTPEGLQYEVIRAGSADSAKPKLTDKVKVHYHGTLINGTVFDSSVDRGTPISWPVNGFIVGWQQALQMMNVGSKWRLYVPADLAYGDNSPGPTIPPGSTLIFDMELLGIENN